MVERAFPLLIASVLKVPERPEPPAGSSSSVRVFNAARAFYRYRVARWVLTQIGAVVGIVAGLTFLQHVEFGPISGDHPAIMLLEVLGVAGFIAQLPVTFLMVGLDYRWRWYIVTDASLRIREGLTVVREQTMTFANIQNLSIRQGPLQRVLGISDLLVRTAGGGGSQEPGEGRSDKTGSANLHLGYFRGVDNAAEIRDVIMSRLRAHADTGLGNPEEETGRPGPVPTSPDAGRDLLAAARELVTEARALGAVVRR